MNFPCPVCERDAYEFLTARSDLRGVTSDCEREPAGCDHDFGVPLIIARPVDARSSRPGMRNHAALELP